MTRAGEKKPDKKEEVKESDEAPNSEKEGESESHDCLKDQDKTDSENISEGPKAASNSVQQSDSTENAEIQPSELEGEHTDSEVPDKHEIQPENEVKEPENAASAAEVIDAGEPQSENATDEEYNFFHITLYVQKVWAEFIY